MASNSGLTDNILTLVSHPDVLAQVEPAGEYSCQFGNLEIALYRPTAESDILTVTAYRSNGTIACWDVLSFAAMKRRDSDALSS